MIMRSDGIHIGALVLLIASSLGTATSAPGYEIPSGALSTNHQGVAQNKVTGRLGLGPAR